MKYFILTYREKPLGDSGESCGTKYIFNEACDVCGTGATVDKELRTKGIEKIKKDFFQTVDGDFIISSKLVDALKVANINIGRLKNIVNYGRETPNFHFSTEIVLPKAFQTKGLIIENQCPKCNRNGFFNDVTIGSLENNTPTKITSVELTYRDIDFNFWDKSDIFNTWECLGLSNRKAEGKWAVRYARPFIVVSEILKNMLENKAVNGLHFDEIKLLRSHTD